MPIELYQVDAFTSEPFRGNPAAVCFPERDDDAWLQRVAAEMNLSETAFLWKRDDGAYRLRWLTPEVEVDLCGHATLASAHVLYETGRLRSEDIARFATRSGELSARRVGDAIELDFPATPATEHEPPPGLLEALGVEGRVSKTRFDYLVELASEDDVRGARPDYAALRGIGVRGVMITARGRDTDIVSRFFAPGSGIDEDPVTGSAHCALAPYWSERLGKRQLVAHQASARGGTLQVELAGDRVKLRGHAVTVLRGQLLA